MAWAQASGRTASAVGLLVALGACQDADLGVIPLDGTSATATDHGATTTGVVPTTTGASTSPTTGTTGTGATETTAAPRGGCTPDFGGTHLIVAMDARTCVLTDGTCMRCWGENLQGALGLGHTSHVGDELGEITPEATTVDLGPWSFVELAGAAGQTCGRTSVGEVVCWGGNGGGKLGRGDTETLGDEPDELGDNLEPMHLPAGVRAVQLALGVLFTCIRSETGHVYCAGHNRYGATGSGAVTPIGDKPGELEMSGPLELGTGRTVVDLQAGRAHLCAHLDDGTLKCWGRNHTGQLGLGDRIDRGNAPGQMGDALPAVDYGSGTIVELALGSNHTCLRVDSGDIRCFGSGSAGQLGAGDANTVGDDPGEMGSALRAVALPAGVEVRRLLMGHEYSCAETQNGVGCWGRNDHGIRGVGSSADFGHSPDHLPDRFVVAELPAGLRTVSDSNNAFHLCGLFADDTLRCWGGNFNGQLGIGTTESVGDHPDEMGDALQPVPL